MPETLYPVTLRSKPGDVIIDEVTKEPKLDADGKKLRLPPVPTFIAHLKSLTSGEAMDADDFALALSKTNQPTADNRIRVFALCAIRRLDTIKDGNTTQETLFRPQDVQEVERRRDMLTPAELLDLGRGHLAIGAKLDEADDAKNSPAGPGSKP